MGAQPRSIGAAARPATQQLRGCVLATIEAAPGLVMVWDTDGHLQYLSGMCRRLLDVGDEVELGEHSVCELYSPVSRERLLNEAIPACLRGDVWRGEMTLMDSEQNEVPVSQVLMAHRIQDPQAGECTVVSGIAWDIREMKQTENTLRHQATHDELTGLPNRLLFQSRLEQAVHAARLDQTLVAVLFMDINGFKQINDTRGHDAGDAVLREFGRRFDGRVRAADTVARFGGDEFVLLVPGLSVPSDVARVMEQIRAIVHEPFRIAEEQLDVTASIGFAMYPFDGLDAAALLRRADRTMYRNKRGLKIAS